MYYRLSNTAEREVIEKEMGVPFKYPGIYNPRPVINGLEESIVPVLTMSNSTQINYAIWGILPENFKEDWEVFQNAFNTLNLSKEACIETDEWYSSAFDNRRCLIIASGFFIFHLYRGDMYPYHVRDKDSRPLSFGGIYNQLDDGFFTCALIVTGPGECIKKIQNFNRGMPLLVQPQNRTEWLSPTTNRNRIIEIICHPPEPCLDVNPISKDFFKFEKHQKSILEPVYYEGLPAVH